MLRKEKSYQKILEGVSWLQCGRLKRYNYSANNNTDLRYYFYLTHDPKIYKFTMCVKNFGRYVYCDVFSHYRLCVCRFRYKHIRLYHILLLKILSFSLILVLQKLFDLFTQNGTKEVLLINSSKCVLLRNMYVRPLGF